MDNNGEKKIPLQLLNSFWLLGLARKKHCYCAYVLSPEHQHFVLYSNDDNPSLRDKDKNVHVSQIHRHKVTHVAIVNVEDMDLCRWLNFLHSGSVPVTAKK